MRKKLFLVLFSVLLIFSLVTCATNQTGGTSGTSKTSSKTLVDGVYSAYGPQIPYTIKSIVTVAGGVVTKCEMEEFHNPSYWATLTPAEAGQLDASLYQLLTMENGRQTYYGKYVTIGTGNRVTRWVVSPTPVRGGGGGEYQFIYTSDLSSNFTEWLKVHENAVWYEEQLLAGNYWITDANGVPLADNLATYSLTFRTTGIVVPKELCRFKTKNRHWTSRGTGFGTESGPLGWYGNMQVISDFLVKYQFPEEKYGRTMDGWNSEDGFIIVADIVSGATLHSGEDWYFPVAYNAYNKAVR